jgi:hypothetical protein
MSRVTTHVSLEDKYNLSHGDAFVTGVQALVQLLVTQHRQDRSDGASAGALVTPMSLPRTGSSTSRRSTRS